MNTLFLADERTSVQLIGRNATEGSFGVRITIVSHWNAHSCVV